MVKLEFRFLPDIPRNFTGKIPIISGEESKQFYNSEYLVVNIKDETKAAFEIRSEYIYNPFKQSEIVDDLLIVGCQDFFYIYDLELKRNILCQKMDGYFGSFEIYNFQVFVADMYAVFCISMEGNIVWHTDDIAHDGVVFHNITDETITCGCQIDPPDIWEDIIIDIKTGNLLNN